MENLKAGGMKISTLLNNVSKVSNSVGLEDKYTEKSSENEVSPCVDPVVQAALGEAKERLTKLEQDYQRIYKNYREVYVNRSRCNIEGSALKHHSSWAGCCISLCKNLVKQLQNVLHSLNIEEASKQGTETPNHSKKFLMLHGCRSLAQEKTILQQKAEHTQPSNDKLTSKEAIDFKEINREFRQIQREIPKISSKKHVHDLLSRIKETNKLREKAVGNNTTIASQDRIKNSTSIVIKLLSNVIKELEKQMGETDSILQDNRRMIKEYTEKLRHLEEKREGLCGKWDDARKHMLGLKNIDDGLEHLRPDSERLMRETFRSLYFSSLSNF